MVLKDKIIAIIKELSFLKNDNMQKLHARYFIGLDLSAQDKLTLEHWREKHLRALPDKPVPAENFHITLSFLGHVHPDKMELLHELLTQVQEQKLQLTTSELGSFQKAQILYLGIEQNAALCALAHQCLKINSALGLPSHHDKYRPHITLTRKHKEIVAIEARPPKLELNFEQFHLFESVSAKKPGTPPHYPKRLSFDLMPI